MYVTRLMAARAKPYLTIYHLQVFGKALHLALLRLMNYRERQQSQFVQVSGLQKLTQKIGLCLQLEMVDFRSRFGLNCIKTYMNCVSVQLFLSCASNTIL